MTQPDHLRFTLPSGQAWTPPIAAGVLMLITVVGGAFGALFLIPLGFIAVVLLLIYFLVMFGSWAVLDETGIRSRRGVFHNKATWDQVREVKLDPKSGQVLMVYRRHGRPFKMGAPVSGGLSTDPEYRAKVAQVLEFVHAHTGT